MDAPLPTLPDRRNLALLALIALLVSLPSLIFGPGATHSHLYNYVWTSQFGAAMQAGDLYPRWLPDSFEGLGSPTFYFYPPIAYWVSGALDAIGLPTYQAVHIAGLLFLLASGVAMHGWLAERGGARPMAGAVLYMLAPYHIFDLLVRGALAEHAAYALLPLVALGIDRLPQRRGVILLALSYGGLLLTHLPTAELAGLFLIAPMIARRALADWRVPVAGALAGLVAFALAAFFLLPALTLQQHISTDMLWTRHYRATDWSIWTREVELFPCMALALILLAWPARGFWTAITVFTALASVRLIPFLWEIDLLNQVQFPWRALVIAEFAAVTAIAGRWPGRINWMLGGAMLLPPLCFTAVTVAGNLYKGVDLPRIARHMPDAPEYLPAGFDARRVDAFDRWADLSPWRGLPRTDRIIVERPGPVTLGRAAFPIWRVTRDGAATPTTGPLLHFQAAPGEYRIERVTLWQERLGWAISALAAMALALIALRQRPTIRHLSKFPAYSPSSTIIG